MKSKQQDFRTERYLRYSIRKYSFGVASVVVVAGLLFLGNGVASASEQQLKETASSTEVVVANSPGSAIFEATDSSVVTAKEEKGEEIQIEEAAHKEAAHTEEDAHTEEAAHTEEFKREEVISQDDTSTGKQGQVQTSISGIERFSRLNDPDVRLSYYSLNGSDDGKVTVEGVGTYSIDLTGVVTFSPLPSFTGTAEGVTVQAGVVQFDDEGNLAHDFYEAHYQPTVTPVVPEGTSVTSKGLQGVVQEGTPVFTAGDDTAPITITQEQPAQFVVDGVAISAKEIPATQSGKEIGTYQIDPSTGRVTFQPHHEFLGTPDPARVQVKDQNGTPATATYTPSVYGLDAKDDTSTGKQGQVQTSISGIERFSRLHDPDVRLSYYSLNGTDDGKVTVERVGTYSIDSTTGTVTFRPLPSFTGTPEGVTVRAVVTEPDIEGNLTQSAYEAHYQPTVTPVVPEGTSVTSKGLQGVVQEGTPVFTAGDDTAPITITQEQPAQFVVDGVAISAKEIPATQSGKEIGTYQIDPSTGRVTFQPHHEFLGTPDPARVQVKDQNGTPATATYTPSVYGLDAKDDTSTGKQGQVQTSISGIERFSRLHDPDVRLSYYSLNGTDDGKVTVERVGTYSIDSTTGTVTFRPLPSFTGTPEGVTVRAVVTEPDIEGNLTQSAYEAHYRPTVTPVIPTAKAAESEAPQGIVQTGRVVFTAGDPIVPINKDTIALLDETVQPATSVVAKSPSGADIGIFTVDKETGLITFMLTDTLYSGEVVPAKIRAQDANGTSVETSYSPKIIPVVPSAKDATSTGKQGQEQSGKPVFIEGDSRVPMDDDTPATFDDGSKTKTITGEGTYTVGTDGTVTFVPDKSFTGTGTGVIVKRVDKNGTSVTAHSRPTVTPVVPVAPVSPVPPFTSVTPTPPVAPASPATPVTSVTPTPPVAPVSPATPVTSVTPTPPETPVSPATPVTSVTPTPPATPVSPVAPEIPMTPPIESGEKEDIQGKEQTGKTSIKLPNTGTKEYTSLVSFGLFGVMSLVYLITRKRKKE